MSWWGWTILGVVVALGVIVFLLWKLAQRLDRLHRRVITTRSALGRGLVKRNAELLRTADLPGIDEESAKTIRESATAALRLTDSALVADGLNPDAICDAESVDKRILAESWVSRTIREELPVEVRSYLAQDVVSQAQLDALDDACYKVALSRTLHNQDVTQVQALRGRLVVKCFRLAGRAPLPNFVDLDDQTK